jgi:hypothetical protein
VTFHTEKIHALDKLCAGANYGALDQEFNVNGLIIQYIWKSKWRKFGNLYMQLLQKVLM